MLKDLQNQLSQSGKTLKGRRSYLNGLLGGTEVGNLIRKKNEDERLFFH